MQAPLGSWRGVFGVRMGRLLVVVVLAWSCADGSAPAGPLPALPSPDTPPPEELDGAAIYFAQCASCHGDHGEGGLGSRIAPWESSRGRLVEIVDASMPFEDPTRCEGACAEVVADYVLTLDGELHCEGVATAPQRTRLLTRREYEATVRDLLAPLGGAGSDPCVDGTRFEYEPATAHSSVHLAGSFNDWDPGAWPMELVDGVWSTTRVLAEGEHEYKLVLDGTEWIADPANPDTAPDGFGGVNSLIRVTCAGAGEGVSVADVTSRFPVDTRLEGHPFDNAAGVVTAVHAQEYLDAGRELARRVGDRAAELVECESGCAEVFARDFGRRAFRRPLSDEEVARYAALADAEGLDAALQAMLISPHFLYRFENGVRDGEVFRLTPWEVATALSYTLHGTTPSDELLDAAANGDLDTPEGIRAQAEALLEDPRSRAPLEVFATQWLGVDTLPSESRSLDAALRESMLAETRALVSRVVYDGLPFEALFTASDADFDDALAAHYGVSAGSTETAPERRAGVLGHGALHASYAHSDQSSPIQRGVFVRQRLLCQEFPPPPPDAGGVPDVDPEATTRERFAQHTESERCASCHQYIDPIGFGFERFDQDGRYRETENGAPIDPGGELRDVEGFGTGTTAAFTSLPELGAALAASEAARDCFARQYWRFARGRHEDRDDACALRAIEDRFAEAGDVRALVLDVLSSDDFLNRRAR